MTVDERQSLGRSRSSNMSCWASGLSMFVSTAGMSQLKTSCVKSERTTPKVVRFLRNISKASCLAVVQTRLGKSNEPFGLPDSKVFIAI